MSIFSERLRALRKMRQNTQENAANGMGISRGMLSNYELGTREPDFVMLCHIADYYEVTTDYLLGRSNEMQGSASSPESEIWNQVTLLSNRSQQDLLVYIQLLKLRDEKELQERKGMQKIKKKNA